MTERALRARTVSLLSLCGRASEAKQGEVQEGEAGPRDFGFFWDRPLSSCFSAPPLLPAQFWAMFGPSFAGWWPDFQE